jgi:hypothetical protein
MSAAGLPRTSIDEFDDKQLDIAAQFRSPDESEITTVFVFRKATGDVPLWFDRIQRSIEAREMFAKPTLAVPPTAFMPAGQSNARGLKAAYATGGPPWKSSAAALTTIGDWYIAVRASSKTLAPDQLLTRVEQTFAAIKWPKEKTPAPAVAPIADCASALPQGTDAEAARYDAPLAVAAALVAAGSALDDAKAKPAVRWCRDPFEMAGAGVYRPDGATDRYFIAYQDAGRGVVVGADDAVNAVATELNKERSYKVELVDVDHHIGFGGFKALPNVAQALWTVEHGAHAYKVTTWGKKRAIEIDPNLAK